MELSDDDYTFDTYDFEFYHYFLPPLIKKKSRLIAAVVQGQLEIVRELMDSPKWYNVKDNLGYNLLQIAILNDKSEIFDFIVSLPDFPLDFQNKSRETALQVAMTGYYTKKSGLELRERFACELIRRGANIVYQDFDGNTCLHSAIIRSDAKVVELLLDKGIDVNARNYSGKTALQLYINSYRYQEEVTHCLLINGAEATLDMFTSYVLYRTGLAPEICFYYIFDEFSDFEVPLQVVVTLAEEKSPFFNDLLKCPIKITLDAGLPQLFYDLCSIPFCYLEKIMQRFGTELIEVYNTLTFESITTYEQKDINLENLSLLVESGLRNDTIDFPFGWDEDQVTVLYCYLMSYDAIVVKERILQMAYRFFGFCDLFKILLYMDITFTLLTRKEIIPELFYNIHIDVDYVIENRQHYESYSYETLCDYFVNPRLTKFLTEHQYLVTRQIQRQIPSLVELSRNEFRKYLIRSYNIKNSCQFFTRVNLLDIDNIYKTIITYERKIY